MATINVSGLDKAAVLAALYNASKPQGMGFMQYDPTPMTVEQAQALLERGTDFDYLKGRIMKIDLSGDEVETDWYDHDNGQNAARQAIDSLRTTADTNNIAIRAQHVSATRAAAQDAREHLSEKTHVSEREGAVVFQVGIGDFAHVLEPRVEEAEKSLKSPLE